MNRRLASTRLARLVLRASLLLATPSLAVVALGGCQSNADKIEAFCTDFHAAVESNTADCAAMATALDEVGQKHAGVKTFGNPDDDESRAAFAPCMEGGRLVATHCASDPAVNEALKSMEGQ